MLLHYARLILKPNKLNKINDHKLGIKILFVTLSSHVDMNFHHIKFYDDLSPSL